MGRMVTVPIEDVTMPSGDADFDIIEIDMGAGNQGKVHYAEITSDVTTAASIRIRMVGRAVNGTGGTAASESALDEDDAAPGIVALSDVDTPGATVRRFFDGFWKQTRPLRWHPIPEAQPIIQAGEIFAINLQTSLASAQQVCGYVVVEIMPDVN